MRKNEVRHIEGSRKTDTARRVDYPPRPNADDMLERLDCAIKRAKRALIISRKFFTKNGQWRKRGIITRTEFRGASMCSAW